MMPRDIDWDSNFMRSFSKLYTDPTLRRPATPSPEYSELPTQAADATTRYLGHLPKYPEPVIENEKLWNIKLNIVIQAVGSRGDVQPFIVSESNLCGTDIVCDWLLMVYLKVLSGTQDWSFTRLEAIQQS
jgi:hypothetical protein